MSTGRCAGCGFTGQPGKVRDHIVECPDFAAAYRRDFRSIGTVEQEYENWVTAGRPAARAAAHAAVVADTDARRAAMASRFATRDILDDEEQ